ncbi:hypothetical protein B7494_g1852 [Chlorociboria aeruginascens]|nr:hypothetical protein B7494_g1852 [Chlorociboria aeruginascens]
MAKGARASNKKANNVKLKSRVFGPVETARTERLSAKLLELASQPKPEREVRDVAMDSEDGVKEADNNVIPTKAVKDTNGKQFPILFLDRQRLNNKLTYLSTGTDIEVDQESTKKNSKLAGTKSRIEKRRHSRRASIVFPKIPTLFLIAANVLIPIAILTFASGFFPYKPFLSGLAEYEALQYGPPPEAPFDKIVFMVVDALRSDFVYSRLSGFTFTQSLIANGAALPFTAHATSPTITMPRIKAITTGSIPSFLDVILNFAESDTSSTLATQDTWLAQMKAKGGGKMIMYGDDTWLKLFPQTFDRSDGTSSFFVSDFTEVDNNVTRHVPDELKNDDWNTMILHYLGLDHIGHKAGPRSPNMILKHREMDGIIRQIFEAIESEPYLESTLLVLCGDHGMNDAGNHGGSSPGETSPALVFISPKLKTIAPKFEVPAPFEEEFQYYKTIEQSDIAPSLGALLGFPTPRNNLGAFIPDFLLFWPDTENDKVQIMLRNARQILNVVTATFPSFERDGPSQDCNQASSSIDELACNWRGITEGLAKLKESGEGEEAWLNKVTQWLKDAQGIMSSTASNYDMSKLVTGQGIAAVSLLFAFAAATITISKYPITISPFLGMTLLFARRWNQTGQKFAGEPDIARKFLFDHNLTLWYLVGATYLWNLKSLANQGFPELPQLLSGALFTALTTAAVTFKFAFTNEDSPELMVELVKTTMDTLHNLLTLFLITQSRTTNIPLFLLFDRQFYLLSTLDLNLIEISTTSLLLQYTSFFAFGGSNAISSIDLSSAYNGVSGYNGLATLSPTLPSSAYISLNSTYNPNYVNPIARIFFTVTTIFAVIFLTHYRNPYQNIIQPNMPFSNIVNPGIIPSYTALRIQQDAE